jgi:DNA-binding SARP family transcriptional activator
MDLQERSIVGDRGLSVLSRDRLTALLKRCIDVKLSLLTAPGGYGKTTLALEMARLMPETPFCWVRPDPADNTLSLFLEALSRAVGPHLPGGSLGIPLGRTLAEKSEVRQLARFVAGELALHAEEHMVVVLDDLHHVEGVGSIHTFLDGLLEFLPPSVHLLVTSRTRPRLPLARLQAHDHLIWVRAKDLGFTPEETKRFFREHLGFLPDEETLSLVVERTEGWIAGLLLVGNLLRSLPEQERPAFMRQFRGHTALFDFLAEEVFLQQTPDLQEFLLTTSVLSDLQPYIVERLTGMRNAGELLRDLEARNLFTFSLADDGRVYRYHHLFQAFLRQRLQAVRGSSALDELHRSAARHYLSLGRMEDGLEHLLSAGEHGEAAPLLAELADVYIKGLRHDVVAGWLRRFPAYLLDTDPDVLYVRAQIAGWMAHNEVLPALYQRCIELYEQHGDTTGLTRVLSWVSRRYWKLRHSYFQEKPAAWAASPHPEVAGYGKLLAAFGLIASGRWTAAIDRLEELHGTFPPASRLYFDCEEALALLAFWAGDFKKTVRFGVSHTLGRTALGDFTWGIYNWAGFVLQGDGVGLELYQKQYLSQEVTPSTSRLHEAIGKIGEAFVHLHHRRWEEELAVLESLRPYYNDQRSLFRCFGSEATYFAQSEMARACRRLGRRQEALAYLERNLELVAGYPEMMALACTDMADYLAEGGDLAGARAFLSRAESAEAPGLRGFDFMVRSVVAARIALREGNRERARRALAEVARLVVERDAPFLLVHYGGPEVMPLLAELDGHLVLRVTELFGEEADSYIAALTAHDDPTIRQTAVALARRVQTARGAASQAVKVFAFGGLRLFREGHPPDASEWKRTKVKLLLLLLLQRRGKPIAKEWLMEAFWPGTEAETARSNLRATIHGLRRVLEPDAPPGRKSRYVFSDRESVSLQEPDQFWFDLWKFEELISRGRQLEREGKPTEALRLLGLAADLWKGPFLPELIFADYFKEVRSRSEQLLIDICIRLAQAKLAEGEYREAASFARRALEADRTVEEAYQVLIRSFLARGDKERALQAYKVCRKNLRAYLGSEPSGMTEQLLSGM